MGEEFKSYMKGTTTTKSPIERHLHEVTELKDLLMTMKDKEIEMMSMLLKAID
jgi:hypothetical protein